MLAGSSSTRKQAPAVGTTRAQTPSLGVHNGVTAIFRRVVATQLQLILCGCLFLTISNDFQRFPTISNDFEMRPEKFFGIKNAQNTAIRSKPRLPGSVLEIPLYMIVLTEFHIIIFPERTTSHTFQSLKDQFSSDFQRFLTIFQQFLTFS